METLAPERYAKDAVPDDVCDDIGRALTERHRGALAADEAVRVDARTGDGAAWLIARVGTEERAHEWELFAQGVPGELYDGALGLLVDWLDAALMEWLASGREAFLPLDFVSHDFDGTFVYARGDVRDYRAEALAAKLLREDQ